MPAKKKSSSSSPEKIGFLKEIKKETAQAIFAIVFILLALMSVLAAFGKAGFVGEYLYDIMKKLLGIGYFLLPILFIMVSASFLRGIKQRFQISKIVGAFIFFLSGLGLINLLPSRQGGIIGDLISSPLIALFDLYATMALLTALLVISILITFDAHFTLEHLAFWKRFFKKSDSNLNDQDAIDDDEAARAVNAAGGNDDISIDPEEREALRVAEEKRRAEMEAQGKQDRSKKPIEEEVEKNDQGFASYATSASLKPFNPPPLSLLEKDRGKPEVGDIKANANIIKRTLQNFGISVEMDEVSIGPSVTRYALKPAEGVKLSKIVALNNDLALALAAHPIRIEAPIPGKSLVGIEIPNTVKTTVGLATLLSSDEYQSSEKPLLISLGKSIAGKAHFSNLAKAPHMLIAGATGSGKSVAIHTLITSLLYRNSPEHIKFIMIDPKRVELTLYNKIPHLLTPVITDPKKAIMALKYAGKEMQRRYDVLESHSARDIDSYHSNILAPALERARQAQSNGEDLGDLPETMPYIVIIIDELADIMQTYPRELEAAIVRLAQMSRAVGIHLVLSTQRPSVNVITGLIKANVPTRIALQVASQIDSRTILDAAGAEKLLGAGDMLYQAADMAKPVRLQSAFISENELKRVVQHLKDQYRDEVMTEINLAGVDKAVDSGAIFGASLDDDIEEDDMYEEAKALVLETNKAATSFLQRKLGIGYSRAAKLIDMMENKGVVGPANGSKGREVYGGSGATTDDTDTEISTENEYPSSDELENRT
jgi:DNA segregation ATPase FtsK/SpoIIIE, S-DNA-T family